MSLISRAMPVFVLMICLTLAGCGDSHEAAVRDLVDTLETFEASLAEIETREQAEAAVPNLNGLAERMSAVEARLEALGTEPADKSEAIDKLSEAMNGIMEQMVRLERADALEPIEPVFAKMGMGASSSSSNTDVHIEN